MLRGVRVACLRAPSAHVMRRVPGNCGRGYGAAGRRAAWCCCWNRSTTHGWRPCCIMAWAAIWPARWHRQIFSMRWRRSLRGHFRSSPALRPRCWRRRRGEEPLLSQGLLRLDGCLSCATPRRFPPFAPSVALPVSRHLSEKTTVPTLGADCRFSRHLAGAGSGRAQYGWMHGFPRVCRRARYIRHHGRHCRRAACPPRAVRA